MRWSKRRSPVPVAPSAEVEVAHESLATDLVEMMFVTKAFIEDVDRPGASVVTFLLVHGHPTGDVVDADGDDVGRVTDSLWRFGITRKLDSWDAPGVLVQRGLGRFDEGHGEGKGKERKWFREDKVLWVAL